ncbi:MAG: hypothetical protein V2A76_11990 [Planctomycetota bacterium]
MSPPSILAVLLAVLLAAPGSLEIGVERGGDPVLVGRALLLSLEVSSLVDARLEFPAEGTEFGTFIFLQGSRAGDEASCALMPTIPGQQTIPPIPILVRRGRDAPAQVLTKPFLLSVGSALAEGEELRLQDELLLERFDGFRLATLWWLLLPAFLVALWLFRRRKKPRERARPRAPSRITPFDPEASALAELSRLLERELAPGDPARLLLADLSNALRRYLSARVDRMSMCRTLEEFEPLLHDLEGDRESDLPRALFQDAELAKFSGRAPAPSAVAELLNRSVLFVRSRSNGHARGAAE